MKRKFASISAMSEEEAKRTKVLGRVYAWYFKEMGEHPASVYLERLNKPMLILQGEKDFQVTADEDLELYKQILSGKSEVTFRIYPGLNHLFMRSVYGTLKKYKKEYKIPSKVDQTVLDDIAQWILSN